MIKYSSNFFKITALISLLFLSGCAGVQIDDGSDRVIKFEDPVKPAPTGIVTVDTFVDDAFALYYSMGSVISELDDFQLYLSGIVHNPIPFLTKTSTLNLQQAAEVVSKGREDIVSLDPATINQVWLDIQKALESKPELKAHLKNTLQNIKADLITNANLNVDQVREHARALRASSKALIDATFGPHMSLVERLLTANAFSQSLDVLGYLSISLPERIRSALDIIEFAASLMPVPESLTMQSAGFHTYSVPTTMTAYGAGTTRKLKNLPGRLIAETPQRYAYEPSANQGTTPKLKDTVITTSPTPVVTTTPNYHVPATPVYQSSPTYNSPVVPVYNAPPVLVVTNPILAQRSSNLWQVQVACFADSYHATQMLNRLQTYSIPALVVANGEAWCQNRVVIAPTNVTWQQAQEQLSALKYKMGIKGYLRRFY